MDNLGPTFSTNSQLLGGGGGSHPLMCAPGFNLCRNNIALQVEHNVARIYYLLVQLVEEHISMLQVATTRCDK